MFKQLSRPLLLTPLLLFIALFLLTPAQAQTAPTAVVNTGALNMRSGPGVVYSVVGVAYQGQAVTLLGRNESSSWLKIRTSTNVEGWSNASLLTTSAALSSLPIIFEAPTLTATAVVATGALNVRTGPGVTYGVVTAVYQGQTVTLLGRTSNNAWVKIQIVTGQQGWVNASLITPNVAISTLPIADVPAQPAPPVPVAPNALLSLRGGPSLSNSVVGHVYQGQRVQAIGRNSASSWVKLHVVESGLEGWIGVGYVQLTVPIESLPVLDGGTTAPPTTNPTPPPTSGTGLTAVITTGALNVRSGPGIGYSKVTIVYSGQYVTLIGRNSNSSWVKVRTSANQEGWVNATYISTSGAVNTLPVLDAPTLAATAVITTGALNVRSGPGITYTATAVVYQGQAVGLIGRNADSSWVKVRLANDHVGWINAAYIQTATTLSNLPVTQ